MERRAFLRGAGIVTVLVAGGGVWRAWDQGVFGVGQGPAYEPWKNWRSASDGPLGLVRAAILAASPHNTQPWLFKVASSSIELHVDTARNTGALDPFLREQHIGLGCALENLMLAAGANGYQARATLMPGELTGRPRHHSCSWWRGWNSLREHPSRANSTMRFRGGARTATRMIRTSPCLRISQRSCERLPATNRTSSCSCSQTRRTARRSLR